MTKNRDLDGDSCRHVQWAPIRDDTGLPIRNEKGEIKHWACSCGKIIPDPPDPHPEESLELLIEELVRASRELLATPVRLDESKAMAELRRSLQASIDEWDRSKK